MNRTAPSAEMTACGKHAASPADETARSKHTAPSADETARDKHTASLADETARDKHTAPLADETACDAPKVLSPHEASCDIPHEAPSAAASDPLAETPHASEGWYAATLRAIVNRALDADKPDIKGALAALQLLAETDNSTAGEDLARTLREARRRVLHAKQTE